MNSKFLALLSGSFLSSSMLLPAAAIAQTSPAGQQSAPETDQSSTGASAQSEADNRVADIVVTAQKRSERLSEVPMSITAASGDQLARQNITGVADLVKITPGLTFQTGSYGTPIYTIRGVGVYDDSLAVTPAVAIYVDQIPLPFPGMTAGAGLDVERVEVLKGPQGTLFGNNTTGGAINYIAAKPTSEFKAGADVTYGRFEEINWGGFVSGPLTENLRARFAFRSEQRGDYLRAERLSNLNSPNDGTGIRRKNGRTLNDRAGQRDFKNARLILDYEPSDRVKLVLSGSAWHDRSDTLPAQFMAFYPVRDPGLPGAFILANRPPAPNDNRVADWDQTFDLAQDSTFKQLALRADVELSDSLTLTSLTSYGVYKTTRPADTDGTDWNDQEVTTLGRLSTFAQELRLAADFGRAKFIVGANYSHDKTSDEQLVVGNPTNFFTVDSTFTGFTGRPGFPDDNPGVGVHRWRNIFLLNFQQVDTYSGFASAEYELTDQLTVQASGRYTKQNRDHQGCLADAGDGAVADTVGVLTGNVVPNGACATILPDFTQGEVRNGLNEDNVSWRGSINYKPNRDTLLYANITKGYKAGSFSTLAAVFAAQEGPVPQESILAYEGGFKSSLLDRRVQLTGSVFYYDYKKKQLLGYIQLPVFGQVPGLISVDGNVLGAEAQIDVRPISGLTISVAGNYTRTKGSGNDLVFDAFARPSPVGGQRFPRVPLWQGLADIEYRFPLANMSAFIGAHANYQGKSYSAFGDHSLPDNSLTKLPAYTTFDLRAGIEYGNWTFSVWGKNVTNKFYVTNVTHVIDTVARSVGAPAFYGATLAFKY